MRYESRIPLFNQSAVYGPFVGRESTGIQGTCANLLTTAMASSHRGPESAGIQGACANLGQHERSPNTLVKSTQADFAAARHPGAVSTARALLPGV